MRKQAHRAGRLRTSALTFLITTLAAAPALGITVDNVIQMHKSGLPSTVIVQTINSTQSAPSARASTIW